MGEVVNTGMDERQKEKRESMSIIFDFSKLLLVGYTITRRDRERERERKSVCVHVNYITI